MCASIRLKVRTVCAAGQYDDTRGLAAPNLRFSRGSGGLMKNELRRLSSAGINLRFYSSTSFFESFKVLKIESASLVPVPTSLESTLNCSLHAMLAVGCG